jgi:D-alanine-D-alanine ligase
MAKTIVGVLRGGTSSEYELSLKTGAAMIAALSPDRYEVRDLFIDRGGIWHVRGTPSTPARALLQLDVVLNALHGGVGENGVVQRLFERAGVPYAGSSAYASALSLDKIRASEAFERAGVAIPRAFSFLPPVKYTTVEMAQLVFAKFGPPYVVKPPREGSSHGVRLARTLPELPEAIASTVDEFGAAVVEEFIHGKEANVGLIEGFRGESLYALPPVRVVLEEGETVQRSHLEEGSLRHLAPSDFSDSEKRALINAARRAHRTLGLSHFSRADLVVTPRMAYLLELDSTPPLYPGSSLPPMLESVGSSVGDFLEHMIALARARS